MGRSLGQRIVGKREDGRRDGKNRQGGTLVIYLDTSAFIKLYFLEDGSDYVQRCVTSQ